MGIRGSIVVLALLAGCLGLSCSQGAIFGGEIFVLCGDGLLDGPEQCDDGNTVGGDGCSASCQVESPDSQCGDGLVDAGEACDDGNTDNDDGCSVYCEMETGFECAGEPSVCTGTCGNAILEYYEQCDDGNFAAGDGCSALCRVEEGYACEGMPSLCDAICGDGLILGDEQCDDGNVGSNDGCDGACLPEAGFVCAGEPTQCEPICGDGVAVGDEDCDEAGETATCDVDCTVVACGDGLLNLTAGEQCDDGNNFHCDGCSAQCVPEPPQVCGDGLVACGEACDDGNTVDGDGCSAACQSEQCGDGILQSGLGEQCDDGGESVTCDGDCTLVSCGDGMLNPTAGEQCDDGNTVDGDGCDAVCQPEQCGDGILQSGLGEQCDDGGESVTCDGDCTLVSCGDGMLNPTAGEECDDGNNVDGDGCDSACVMECDPTINLALEPGVVATSSGGGVPPAYGPDRMIDGYGHADCATQHAHWVDAQSYPDGAWIQLTWPAPVLIGRILVDTVDAHVADCIGSFTGRSLAGATIQWWDGTAWQTVGTTAGHLNDWSYAFGSLILTDRIRLYDIYTCDQSLCSWASMFSNPVVIELKAFCP